ncbi:MAG: transglutaminase-like domain-containing protein [Burkholderiaceae bacterium]|nr:transglutaminase-like domain-containing protein [Burkholderiaceae bacterium]
MHAAPHTTRAASQPLTHGGIDRPSFIGMGRRFLRAVSVLVIAAMLNTSLTPLVQAAQQQRRKAAAQAVVWKSAQTSADRQLAELIDNVRATLMSPAGSVMRKQFNVQATLERFDALTETIHASIDAERQATPRDAARLDNLQQQFDTRSHTFRAKLQALAPQGLVFKSAPGDGADLTQWLQEVAPLKKPENLAQMPFSTLKPNRHNIPHDFEAEPKSALVPKTAPQQKGAAVLKALPDFSNPQYLASAGEAEITADIKAKTQELNSNPVQIYEWVRNNVEWQPTWGGQQTADMTLDVKRGNAMDIATLTVALLRAANIPARYAYGTVDVPAEQFLNMAGNFTDINAAWDFASAGGIPIIGITSGGKVTKLRMEHVWVEAAVPYTPGRGARPVSANNPIDAWVPMDPSAKQYNYLSGIDVQAIANIDGQQLANNFTHSGAVNEQQGWVQGLNQQIIADAQTQAQQKLQTYINGMSNPTVGDVIGGRTIKPQTLPYLAGTLPYPNSARGSTYAQLPDSLRTRVTLGLGWDPYDQSYQQSKTLPLYQLNQRSITISFKPASTADENALAALIPPNLTDPSQLPSFLPSSIRVIPEIKRDDEVLLTASSMALGEEIGTGYSFQTPTQSYLDRTDSVIAGSYLALGIVGSNPSRKTFDQLKASLTQTKQILETGTQSQKAALTRDKLFGDMFITGVQGYYAQYITHSKLLSLRSSALHQSVPMAGTFGYEPYQRTLFGLNRGIETFGMYMNVRTAQVIKDKNGDGDKAKQLMLQVGMLSSTLESGVPEMMFTDPNNSTKPEGFSTAKALAMAMQQGQRIYTITQQNQATALPALHLDSLAMSEISDALAAGKEVTTHTDQLTVPGFKGSGYVIADPITGDGTYKISGGKNGSFLAFLTGIAQGAALAAILVAFFAVIGTAGAPLIVLLVPMMAILMLEIAYAKAVFQSETEVDCMNTGRSIGAALTGVMAGFKASLKTGIEALVGAIVFGVFTNQDKDISKCLPGAA